MFDANALIIDTENAFLKFSKTHVDNVRKRTEKKLYENAQRPKFYHVV